MGRSKLEWYLVLFICLNLFVHGCGQISGGSDGSTESSSHTTSSSSEYEDLTTYQWALENNAQTSFATYAGVVGEDINQSDNYSSNGYTGAGITVAVVDTGVEIGHVDLTANVISGGSWDFVYDDTDPTSTAEDGDHGTSVTGLIAAEDNIVGTGASHRMPVPKGLILLPQISRSQIKSLRWEDLLPLQILRMLIFSI